jgi:16S rRNA processing protein RimM
MSCDDFTRNSLAHDKSFVAVGIVKMAWGRLGELRVKPLTDNPDRFLPGRELYIFGEQYVLETVRYHKGDFLLKLQGINNIQDASSFAGATMEVPLDWLDQLPKDTFYQFQLLGMEVWNSEGDYLGKVTHIIETGSNDVYVVHGGDREILIPAIGDVVKHVDVEIQRMVVDLMEGL